MISSLFLNDMKFDKFWFNKELNAKRIFDVIISKFKKNNFFMI